MNHKRLPWIVTAFSLILLGGILLGQRMRHGGEEHPDPRPGVSGASVLPGGEFASSGEDVVRAYEVAAQYPEVMDGLFCHCQCKRTMGHRSLLTCFESEHASGCDICQGEALMAARMHEAGASLDSIRSAIDHRYGS